MKFEPKPYQKYCIDRAISQNSLGLLLDMGMGKTAISLTVIEVLIRDYFAVQRCLIIAPLRPARETWTSEIAKWDHLQGLTSSLVLGSQNERLEALRDLSKDIYIINREQVAWLVNLYKNKWPFDMVVIDELSSFKSSSSQRFRALKKVRPFIKRIMGLTGTPAPNSLLDLWPQMYLLDNGEALGKTVTGYRDKYFLPDKRNATTIFSWKLKEGSEELIYKQISDTCISMKSEDFLELPERLEVRQEVVLSDDAMATYRRLERDMLLPYDGGDIDAGSAAVLMNKLLQVAGGAAYNENGEVQVVHDDKLDALDDLIEQANGQNVLLFYSFRHEAERIKARHPEAVDVKEPDAIKRWLAGKIPLLIAHPASAGHGLNLQGGGHIIIWYGLPLSLELYQQANKRLHRMGQRETVLIHHLVAKGTVDERVLDQILTDKTIRQNALIDALKARIQEVKNAAN